MLKSRIIALTATILCTAGVSAGEAPRAPLAPTVDGIPDDEAWKRAEWVALEYSVLETTPFPGDFSGRYKVVWTPEYLYVLAQITDDILIDTHPDPLVSYWNDDTLEIFVDEDASGGNHRDNDNAYAYHISLDNQIIDIGPNGQPTTYPSHVAARWRRAPEKPHDIYWEARIAVFAEGASAKRTLNEGNTIGFMVAYCDADSPDGRDHFFGDVEIQPVNGDRNLGYIDADVFGRLTLTD